MQAKTTVYSNDISWMSQALHEARKGEGKTRPNPPVGAIVVKNGKIIGRGWHRKAGGPHAEVYALAEAGKQAQGGTLYVTLEPCCTWGRTPPCTDAIVSKSIARVVVGSTDINPQHQGRGLALLRKAGLSVTSGVLRTETDRLVAPFGHWMSTGRPFITLKMASSLDGRIADAKGRARWITSPPARRMVQALRQRCDAILVGANTVRLDNPTLLPCPSSGRSPWRIIVSRKGDVPVGAKVFNDAEAHQTILATTFISNARRIELEKRGVAVWLFRTAKDGIPWTSLLRRLGKQGILHILCEGGGAIAGALLRHRLVNEVYYFIAPLWLGSDAVPVMEGRGWPIFSAPRWRIHEVMACPPDMALRLEPFGHT